MPDIRAKERLLQEQLKQQEALRVGSNQSQQQVRFLFYFFQY